VTLGLAIVQMARYRAIGHLASVAAKEFYVKDHPWPATAIHNGQTSSRRWQACGSALDLPRLGSMSALVSVSLFSVRGGNRSTFEAVAFVRTGRVEGPTGFALLSNLGRVSGLNAGI
jgi:hypothetical protein